MSVHDHMPHQQHSTHSGHGPGHGSHSHRSHRRHPYAPISAAQRHPGQFGAREDMSVPIVLVALALASIAGAAFAHIQALLGG